MFKKGDPITRLAGMKGQESYRSLPKEQRKPRGFAARPELAKQAGRKGGIVSKRRKVAV